MSKCTLSPFCGEIIGATALFINLVFLLICLINLCSNIFRGFLSQKPLAYILRILKFPVAIQSDHLRWSSCQNTTV